MKRWSQEELTRLNTTWKAAFGLKSTPDWNDILRYRGTGLIGKAFRQTQAFKHKIRWNTANYFLTVLEDIRDKTQTVLPRVRNTRGWSVSHVANRYGLNPKKIRIDIRSGKLPAVKVGSRWTISPSLAEQYAKQ